MDIHDKLDLIENEYSFFLFSQLYQLHKPSNTEYDLLYLEIRKEFIDFLNSSYNTGEVSLYESIENYLSKDLNESRR